MAAHDEFALKQNNPCFIGLGSVGASQPSHFDMVRHLSSQPSRAPRESPVPLPRSFFAAVGTSPAVAALTTTTAGAAEPEKTNRERDDDPTDDPGGGGSGRISQSKLHKALKRLVRHRRDEDGLVDDVLQIARFAKTKRSKRAGTRVRARNELGQWMSLKEGVGVSVSLPQHQQKKHEETKTEDTKTEEQQKKNEETKTEDTKAEEQKKTNTRTNPKTKTNAGAAAVAAIGTGTGTGVARRGKRAEDRAQRARARKAEVQVAELKAQVADLLAQVKGGYVVQNEDPGAQDQGDQLVLLDMAVTTAKSSAAAGREAAQRARDEEAKWKARAGVWEERYDKATAEMAQGQVEAQAREAEVEEWKEEVRGEIEREKEEARRQVRVAEVRTA